MAEKFRNRGEDELLFGLCVPAAQTWPKVDMHTTHFDHIICDCYCASFNVNYTNTKCDDGGVDIRGAGAAVHGHRMDGAEFNGAKRSARRPGGFQPPVDQE
jgi:hypothetical protein